MNLIALPILTVFWCFTVMASQSCLADNTMVAQPDLSSSTLYSSVKLSPDGEKLSALVLHQGVRQLIVYRLSDFSLIGGVRMPQPKQIVEHYWINEERIVMAVVAHQADQVEQLGYGELVAVNSDGNQMKTDSLLRKDAVSASWAEVISVLPDDDMHILVAVVNEVASDRDATTIGRVNVNSGLLKPPHITTPISFSSTLTDQTGQVRFTSGLDDNDTQRSYLYDNDDWKDISHQFGEGYTPLSVSGDGNKLFYLSSQGANNVGLFSFDFENGAHNSIYTGTNFDISNISFSTDGGFAYALRIDNAGPTYFTFDSTGDESRLFKSLSKTFAGSKINITGRTKDGKKWLVFVEDEFEVSAYYLYDIDKNLLSQLFSNESNVTFDYLSDTRLADFLTEYGKDISV